jgi:lipopolysaccharide transport system permease protein
VPVIDIEPTRGWRAINLADLWRYRELLYILVWRDLKVRYRQTLLGALWVMGQPLLTMVIFTVLFNRLARIEAGGGVPYAVFVLAGLLPWTFFSAGVTNSGNSLIGSAHLISKVYFPRLIIPASAVLAALADFGVSCLVLAGLMAWYQVVPSVGVLLLPAVVALAVLLATGVGLWLSALNVEYRDVRVVIPFLMQFWMYATPVVYPMHLLPEHWRPFVALNPLTGVVEAFRACLLGTTEIPWLALGWSTLAGLALFVSGAYFFRRTERQFADLL